MLIASPRVCPEPIQAAGPGRDERMANPRRARACAATVNTGRSRVRPAPRHVRPTMSPSPESLLARVFALVACLAALARDRVRPTAQDRLHDHRQLARREGDAQRSLPEGDYRFRRARRTWASRLARVGLPQGRALRRAADLRPFRRRHGVLHRPARTTRVAAGRRDATAWRAANRAPACSRSCRKSTSSAATRSTPTG